MQKIYKNVGYGFHKTLTSLISVLRRQKILIDEMQDIYPNSSIIRWTSMSRVFCFLNKRRSKIMAYFEQSDVCQRIRDMISLSWWIMVAVVRELSGHVSQCVEGLQERRTTLQQQKSVLQDLLTNLQRFACVERVGIELNSSPSFDIVTLDRWEVSHANLIGLIEDQGMFATQALAEMNTDSKSEVLHAIRNLFLEAVCNLSKVEATCNELNQAASSILQPCLTLRLVAMKTREIIQLVLKYQYRLQLSWEQEDINKIVEKLKELLVFVNRKHCLRNALSRFLSSLIFAKLEVLRILGIGFLDLWNL